MGKALSPTEWNLRYESVWAELTRFLHRSHASLAVLVDSFGNAVTYAGEDPEFDLSSFASLAVADYLASREMAILLGESEMQWVVHEAVDAGLVLAPLHPGLILAVLFDDRSTLGLVRHQFRKDRQRLVSATRPLLELLASSAEEALQDEILREEALSGEALHDGILRGGAHLGEAGLDGRAAPGAASGEAGPEDGRDTSDIVGDALRHLFGPSD